jgi:tRNA(Ile)-lysidine synthase
MLRRGTRLGVAVSGGADSLVLLEALHRLSQVFEVELAVLHVNHRLRGAESDEDEQFVRGLAASRNLAAAVGDFPMSGSNLEEQARESRNSFFFSCMKEMNLAGVALGHTRSDQAETVLYRLCRGAGIRGLTGVRPVTATGFVRPLLTLSRTEVRDWADKEGLVWREDSSNRDTRFARNLIRHEILPELRSRLNPALDSVLARTAGLALDEEDYWDRIISEIYATLVRRSSLGTVLDVALLGAQHIAIQRRLVRFAICKVRGTLKGIELHHIDSVLGICTSSAGHDRVNFPGVDALRSYECLLLARPGVLGGQVRGYSVVLHPGGTYELPFEAGTISLQPVAQETLNCDSFKKDQQLSADSILLDRDVLLQGGLAANLVARNWEPGDALQPVGHESPKKIKQFFGEQRVLLWDRRHWPVVVREKEIVWVRQFGGAAKFCATGKSRRILRLSYSTVRPEN